MRKSVYIETTIVSYLTSWPSKDAVKAVRQKLTAEWWKVHRKRYDLFISPKVLDEAARGDAEAAALIIEAIDKLPLLEGTIEVDHLAANLIKAKALPKEAMDDAFHLALAAYHDVDILLTWNYTHLVNGNLMGRMSDQIRLAGYRPPSDMYSRIIDGEEAMKNDIVFDDIQKVKRSIAEKYNYDVFAMGKALREIQRKSGHKVVNLRARKLAAAGK